VPASRIGSSANPNVDLANSVRNGGENRITVSPTARMGDDAGDATPATGTTDPERCAHRRHRDQRRRSAPDGRFPEGTQITRNTQTDGDDHQRDPDQPSLQAAGDDSTCGKSQARVVRSVGQPLAGHRQVMPRGEEHRPTLGRGGLRASFLMWVTLPEG
jgi:hypothetical protein